MQTQINTAAGVQLDDPMSAIVQAATDRILTQLQNGERRLPTTDRVRYGMFDEFLAPDEWRDLLRFTIDHEPKFQVSQVIGHHGNTSQINLDHRRSKVLFEFGHFSDIVATRLRHYLPRIASSLGLPNFTPSQIEQNLTASNDAEFFRMHNDNSHAMLERRAITFVLFFFDEPKSFSGGHLRLFETSRRNGQLLPTSLFTEIVPRQNLMVFFPSHLMHEVTTVHCAPKTFRNSRFTLNGWIHR
jgi:SM-20-related protein